MWAPGLAGQWRATLGVGPPRGSARQGEVAVRSGDGSGEDLLSAADRDRLAVRVRGLRKSYGGFEAVAGVDLDVTRGEVFALLGPNGAGKTTTVEILEGYRHRDAGAVSVLGIDPGHHRARLKPRIGIVLQTTGIEPYLTVRETVTMYAGYYPHPRPVDEVIELVALTSKRDERVNRLSGGQQRRLDMAVALVGDPDLLFLDEPTTGFDPSARHDAWDMIKNLASLGKTVILTTHYMDEAQNLADHVAVIAAGRIIAYGEPSTIGVRGQAQALIRYRLPAGVAPPSGFGEPAGHNGFVEVRVADPVVALHDLTGWSIAHAVPLEALEVTRPSLEDVYLELTNAGHSAPISPPDVRP